MFLGYSPYYKGYRCLYPPTGRVYISRHVIFDEEIFPFKEQYKSLVPRYETRLLKAWQSATSTPEQEPVASTPTLLPTVPRSVTPPPAVTVEQQEVASPPLSPVQHQQQFIPDLPQQNVHPMRTRAKSGISKPNFRYALVSSKFVPTVPKNIEEAMAHSGWNNVVTEEITKVHVLNTWTLVPRTPDMNVLTSGWVHTVKFNPDGTVKQLKSHLVARGNQQEEGIDYLKTFSPVVRTATIRLMLNVATARDWPIKQLDVSSAFLHGELSEPVYMFQPDGFVDPNRPDHVCCLTKALYGLKQAPHAWFDTFSSFLLEFGFV